MAYGIPGTKKCQPPTLIVMSAVIPPRRNFKSTALTDIYPNSQGQSISKADFLGDMVFWGSHEQIMGDTVGALIAEDESPLAREAHRS